MRKVISVVYSFLLLLRLRDNHAFVVPAKRLTVAFTSSTSGLRRSNPTTELFFSTNNNNDENNTNNDASGSSDGKFNRFKSLLGRLLVKETPSSSSSSQSQEDTSRDTSLLVVDKGEIDNNASNKEDELKYEALEPMEQAKRLRSAAEKARLEAERMDVALTLEKIARLEKEMTKPNAEVDTLQQQLMVLQRKLAQSSSSSTINNSHTTTTNVATSTETTKSDEKFTKEEEIRDFSTTELSKIVEPVNEDDIRKEVEILEMTPKFMLESLAGASGEVPDENGVYNLTSVAMKLDQVRRYDFSNNPKPAPVFSAAQIKEKEEELKKEAIWWTMSPLKAKAGGNSTRFALLLLEFEYYTSDDIVDEEDVGDFNDKLTENNEWLQQFNKSRVDSGIDMLYPACTRRSEIPTEAVMERFMKQVLPKTDFVPSGTYQKVESGYIIRGSAKHDNSKVVESIDRALGPLAEKMTVLYTPDFTIYTDDEIPSEPFFDPNSQSPMLYVIGPEATRESKPIQLGITSALGLATSWYLSIYPFLFNTGIAKRVDDDLALVDAGLQPDLLWLTDLSVPLFASFMSILLAHEMGHIIAAGIHKFKSSVPIFVPSFITGVTSTVTTFKTLPPTKNAMFDFGLAGPALGIFASVAALAVGSQLTVAGDPTNFPALPLDILRQSTLGGGIIDYFLGGGALYVPEGALGTSAVAQMTIPLHPIALAGYIGLIVNALSLLPIGTTDGGRIALALFGRPSKLAVGNITMFALLIAGVLGSDLFLFYFAFCLAFQSGNEVPARNEVERVDLPRVFAATGAYIIVLLALIPFQI